MRRFWICDWADGRAGCPPHKRIYSLTEQAGQPVLDKGATSQQKKIQKGVDKLGRVW